MAKRFAFVSFGILCLVAAYQLGARDARAEWQPGVAGQVVGLANAGDHLVAYDRSGDAWGILPSVGWMEDNSGLMDLPPFVGDVTFVEGGGGNLVVLTSGDVLWSLDQTTNPPIWVNRGPFPGGPVSLEEQSWGKTKADFR